MPRSSRLKAKKEKDLKTSSESCKRIDNYFNPPITSDLVIEKQIIEDLLKSYKVRIKFFIQLQK